MIRGKKVHPGGRPTKINEKVLAKLEDAFSIGASDKEACLLAEIEVTTLYRYCRAHPSFARKKEALKDAPLLKARMNIAKELQKGDKEMSKWYLERKKKDEFSLRTEYIGFEGEIEIDEESEKNLIESMKKTFGLVERSKNEENK